MAELYVWEFIEKFEKELKELLNDKSVKFVKQENWSLVFSREKGKYFRIFFEIEHYTER
mgnify:CR=1 FL=1